MTALDFDISVENAEDSKPVNDTGTTWFDPEYPDSTPDAPYGFFPTPDGKPDYSRPRKRRPKGSGKSTSGVSMSPRPSGNARTAAALLARMNMLLGLGLITFGMPMTAESLKTANQGFEDMAYDALLNDPALCKKILSAGASSGKSQLVMAYAMLGVAIGPAAFIEVKAKRAEVIEARGLDND